MTVPAREYLPSPRATILGEETLSFDTLKPLSRQI
jgi:hypothetical protein